LSDRSETSLAATHDAPPASVDAAKARALTERIKSATNQFCLLLLEAHERRAWVALGYGSWGEYVRSELVLSRSRSYELLDQARVIRTIQVETGTTQIPNISPYAAGQIRAHMGEITMEIRSRTADAPREHAVEVVMEIINEVRTRVTARLESSAPPAGPATIVGLPIGGQPSERDLASSTGRAHLDLARLRATIRRLANMPSTEKVVAQIPEGELPPLATLSKARSWLVEFADRQLRPDDPPAPRQSLGGGRGG
jgi:hypothetical protein